MSDSGRLRIWKVTAAWWFSSGLTSLYMIASLAGMVQIVTQAGEQQGEDLHVGEEDGPSEGAEEAEEHLHRVGGVVDVVERVVVRIHVPLDFPEELHKDLDAHVKRGGNLQLMQDARTQRKQLRRVQLPDVKRPGMALPGRIVGRIHVLQEVLPSHAADRQGLRPEPRTGFAPDRAPPGLEAAFKAAFRARVPDHLVGQAGKDRRQGQLPVRPLFLLLGLRGAPLLNVVHHDLLVQVARSEPGQHPKSVEGPLAGTLLVDVIPVRSHLGLALPRSGELGPGQSGGRRLRRLPVQRLQRVLREGDPGLRVGNVAARRLRPNLPARRSPREIADARDGAGDRPGVLRREPPFVVLRKLGLIRHLLQLGLERVRRAIRLLGVEHLQNGLELRADPALRHRSVMRRFRGDAALDAPEISGDPPHHFHLRRAASEERLLAGSAGQLRPGGPGGARSPTHHHHHSHPGARASMVARGARDRA
eukprot:scaffold301_cov243-Pinguiococcus_pyrenoidosus.AAC.23